jgi:antitoxin CptB
MSLDLEHRRRRALYRAQHRGTKEMDWLVGRFVETHIGGLDEAGLALLEEMLAIPDPELHEWIMQPAQTRQSQLAPLVARLRDFHGMS